MCIQTHWGECICVEPRSGNDGVHIKVHDEGGQIVTVTLSGSQTLEFSIALLEARHVSA